MNVGTAYDDSHMCSVAERASELGVRRPVAFLEDVPQEDLVALINSADSCVHAATRVGFGLAVVEEMVCGNAVVAFRMDSIPEIIDGGVDGLLADPNDDESLFRSLLMALGDWSLARSLDDAARAKVIDRFTWNRTA